MAVKPFHRLVLLAVLALSELTASAQPARRVLMVLSAESGPYRAVEKAFTAGLGAAPVVVLATNKDQTTAALNEANALVVAVGTAAAELAKAGKPETPVLYAMVHNTAKLGVDAAGVVPMYVPPVRQLKALKQAVPSIKAVGIASDPAESQWQLPEYEAAAKAEGLRLVVEQVSGKQDVARAVRALAGKVDALWLVPDRTIVAPETFRFIVETSVSSRIPVLTFSSAMAKAGALVGIEVEHQTLGAHLATLAKRRLAGGKEPATPAEPKLYLNSKTAELMGLSLSSAVKELATVF